MMTLSSRYLQIKYAVCGAVCGLGIIAGISSAPAATTYIYSGTTNTASNWFTATNWSPNGVPGTGDTVVLTTGTGSSGSVVVNTNTSILDLNASGMTGPSTILGANTTLTITGTLTKATSSSLFFRNNSSNTLGMTINDLQETGGGQLAFGTSESNRMNTLSITSATIDSSILNLTGANGSTFYIDTLTLKGSASVSVHAAGKTAGDTGTLVVKALTGGSSSTIAAINGSSAGTTGSAIGILQINSTSGVTSTYDGLLADAINSGSGTLKVTKSGDGTQILTKASTYTGGTTISAGTLVIANTSGSATGTGTVTINGTGTLAGTGLSTGTLTVASGGTLSPGSTSAASGSLTVGTLSLQSGSTLAIDLNGTTAGTSYDQLNANGTVTLAGTLSVTLGYTPAANSTFIILQNDGSDAIIGTFIGLSEGATWTTGEQTFSISYVGGDGNDVVVTALAPIPEPSAMGILGLGSLSLLVKHKPRHKQVTHSRPN